MRIPAVVARRIEALWHDADRGMRAALLDAVPNDPSAHLLDVGCHDGSFTAQVARRLGTPPSQVAGIELIAERREEAAARGFDARDGDIERRWPFEAASFDLVHANQVIEHVKGLDHFMEESVRVLRPGGRLVVCTENLASWPNAGALLLGYTPFSITNVSTRGALGNPFALHLGGRPDAPGDTWLHVHVLTLEGLRSLFALHGFTVERTFGAGYFPAFGHLSARLSQAAPRRAHFVGLVGRTAA